MFCATLSVNIRISNGREGYKDIRRGVGCVSGLGGGPEIWCGSKGGVATHTSYTAWGFGYLMIRNCFVEFTE